ncbi:MAG: hydrogenase maturation protease, partial [Gammaproteobacteria bacterium]|nr:hydrogenase maturation protease [Gammaproteobacteria bacterium]
MTKPVVVFAIGNPSRGDDALAPTLVEVLKVNGLPEQVELIDDFQLQIEHTLDLKNRSLILFVDACMSCCEPFQFNKAIASVDPSFGAHELSPSGLLEVYQQTNKKNITNAYVLAIKGYQFDLGSPLSTKAKNNLDQALKLCDQLM